MALSFFRSTPKNVLSQVKVDIHSHLINEVDDGSDSLETSLGLIEQFNSLGIKKIITTPHIMADYYNNSKETLFPKRDIIKDKIEELGFEMQFECAAEYYLDEGFISKVAKKEELLLIGDSYVLFETGFMNQPIQLHSTIFNMLSNGLKPILAHPERYIYLHESIDKAFELKEKGVLLQLNLNSLTGYYSKGVKKYAEKLIDAGLIDFIGSDCHNQKHFDQTQAALSTKYYEKVNQLPLLNDSVL